jgi:uncharacterized membrane protein
VVAAASHDWALFFHIIGALTLVAGVTVAGVAFEAARRRARPDEVATLLGLTRVGVLLVVIGGVLVLAFGLWLVDLEDDIGFGTGWVSAALALFVAVMAIGAVGGQRPKRARKLAAQLAREGKPESGELRGLLDDRIARALNYLAAALLVAIVVLMVFKPGGEG